jgi:hypothetical protein
VQAFDRFVTDSVARHDLVYKLAFRLLSGNLLILLGERAGARTRDHLIKSQVLYQLSYALAAGVCRGAPDAGQ